MLAVRLRVLYSRALPLPIMMSSSPVAAWLKLEICTPPRYWLPMLTFTLLALVLWATTVLAPTRLAPHGSGAKYVRKGLAVTLLALALEAPLSTQAQWLCLRSRCCPTRTPCNPRHAAPEAFHITAPRGSALPLLGIPPYRYTGRASQPRFQID